MKDDNENNIDHFTREYLRSIDLKLDRIDNDIRDIKIHLGQLETTLTHHTTQFDRLYGDIDLIKRRLDLVEV